MNVFFIYEFKEDNLQYATIILLYWCQSVLLGIFNFADMLTLKKPNVENMTINGRPATASQAKGCVPFFFLFHYGVFHIVFFVFIVIKFSFLDADFSIIKWAIFSLIINQFVHFVQNKTIYSNIPRNVGFLFFTPYLRVVPMFAALLLPVFFGLTPALIFMILKAVFDLIGHIITTKYYWNKDEESSRSYLFNKLT